MSAQSRNLRERRTAIVTGRPVPIGPIRRLASEIANQFDPEQIILFGSYAYGRPHAFSDVDLLVVLPARNEIDKAVQILNSVDPSFSVDLIVRTPHNFRWRLEEGDWFLREVVSKGMVLYSTNVQNLRTARRNCKRGLFARKQRMDSERGASAP